MRYWLLLLLALTIVPGCMDHHEHPHGGHDDHDAHGGHDDHDGHEDEGEEDAHGHGHGAGALAFTRWTDRTELFVEFPPLVVGQKSPFAAHLTRLSDFRPVDHGTVTVLLTGGGAAEERFAVEAPSVAGIFRPVAKPARAGTRRVTIRLESPDLEDVHDLGEMTVYADPEAAAADAEEEGDDGGQIGFLKEQQWPIDFATEEVVERTIRPSLRMNGTLRGRADGEVWVTAPVSGRLSGADGAFPRIGMNVARGDVLAVVVPRLGPESDVASLELAARRAALELEQARRERKRLGALLAEGAVPERRVLEARNEEQQAEARVQAAERRLDQHRAVQRTGDERASDGTAVPAPIAGTVATVSAAPGQFVDDGESLFHLVDLDRLWLEVRVPEANIGELLNPGGVWFRVEGFDQTFEAPADRVVAMGGVVEKTTRTVPLLFEVDNPGRILRVGMFARANVLMGPPRTAVALPVDSIISDAGMDTAYVQTEGESFERRIVRLGVRDREYVEVLSGVEPGEHVVTRGAYAVKLAAAGTQVPAHGHAH
jgi:cobalt-zinc-cadmium efflux system membrane fusion protein